MSDINLAYLKTFSRIIEKLRSLQEQINRISDIEKTRPLTGL